MTPLPDPGGTLADKAFNASWIIGFILAAWLLSDSGGPRNGDDRGLHGLPSQRRRPRRRKSRRRRR